MIQLGLKIVFGVRPLQQVTGAPLGRMKIRMRKGCIARCYVRTADGIRSNRLIDLGTSWYWDPRLEEGANYHERAPERTPGI